MLIAIRDHFTVEDKGAIGYCHGTKEERIAFALSSRRSGCKACGYVPPPLPVVENAKLADASVQANVRIPHSDALNQSQLVSLIIAGSIFLMLIVFSYFVHV
jgi:hypothetical protein